MSNAKPFTELLATIVDNRGRSCPTSQEGIPLIATNCINNDALYPIYDKVRFVSQETFHTWFRGHPEPGDLIFVTKGSPGRVCMAPDPVDFCIAQDMVAVRPDSKKVYPKYLFAALRSHQVQQAIGNMHVGTLIPHFKKGDFDKLDIPLPDSDVQKTIGDMYYSLSAKIELNRRMNETLEAMARAIFKSWFVDFDPVRAKASGEPPESICRRFGLNPDTLALFPDSFQGSELGEIPARWEVTRLADTSIYLSRGISPKYIEKGGVCVLNQKCVRDGKVGITSARRHDVAHRSVAGRELRMGDILVNSTGTGTLGRIAQVTTLGETTIVDSHVTVVRANPKTSSPTYLFMAMFHRQSEIEALGEGSTGQTELSRARLAAMAFLAPPVEVTKMFDARVKALREASSHNDGQSFILAELRDAVLPKLLSGEVATLAVENQVVVA